VRNITIRFANESLDKLNRIETFQQRLEVLSLVGTISPDFSTHLHISLGDHQGNCIGGHLVGDAIVFTTLEIVLGEVEDVVFDRQYDPVTGFPELLIKPRHHSELVFRGEYKLPLKLVAIAALTIFFVMRIKK
jgi:predicted DNA-binding protein with PD1-like motif